MSIFDMFEIVLF